MTRKITIEDDPEEWIDGTLAGLQWHLGNLYFSGFLSYLQLCSGGLGSYGSGRRPRFYSRWPSY
jgi:hypothetical protein